MITGTTRNGFAFSIDEGAMDDMELVDALAEVTDNNAMAISKVCVKIFGKEQRKRLYDSLRTEEGRVPLAEVSEAIADVMTAFGEAGKN